MHFLVYLSDYTGPAEHITEVLTDICTASRRNNAEVDITGLLFFQKGVFLQALEGNKDAISALMRRVDEDPRHANIQILVDEPIKKRSFGEWHMDSLNMDEHKALDPDVLLQFKQDFSKQMQMDAGFFIEAMKMLVKQSNFSPAS